jgi:FkbM family methyltransferase
MSIQSFLFICLIAYVKSDEIFHAVYSPSDVLGTEAEFETDHWGKVNFDPVPSYLINTHDPVTQDEYISASVHEGTKPWDYYIWDRIVSLTPHNMIESELIFVDVGANIGYFTLAAASLGYDVIAFEPMSRNAKKLSKSIEANNFTSRVQLYQNAVNDLSGQRVVLRETDATNQGNGQITQVTNSVEEGTYGVDYVRTITLSDILKGRDAFIVKIDVEGYEGSVIKGAEEWICGNVIKHIIIEISDATRAKVFPPLADVMKFMQRIGYELFDVAIGSETIPTDGNAVLIPNVLFSLTGESPTCNNSL